MTGLLRTFLEKIEDIKRTNPEYRQPGDGSDGTCDCIGLIIGALRRMGQRWDGIHGSNYAVRKASNNFRRITNANQLEVGEMVFKARQPGEEKYDLPNRYKQGGSYFNGDMNDYYHVGVVTQVNPLRITHMTTPNMKVDTKLGRWAYASRIKQLDNAGAYDGSSVVIPQDPDVAEPDENVTSGATAVVTAPSGRYVKMRKLPSTRCSMYEQVPIGAVVTLVKPGEEWAQISYGRRTGWYMMAKFLEVTHG